MHLYRSPDDPGIVHPEDSEVVAALDRALMIPDTVAAEERLVILSAGPLRLLDGAAPDTLQLTAGPSGWVVEHGDSRSGRLYRSPRGLPPEHVRGLFLSFLRGDGSYREAIRWRDVSADTPRSRRRSALGILFLAIAFLAGAAAVALLASLAL